MSRTLKTLGFFVVVTLLLAVFSVSALAQMKIGYIRSEYLFSKYEPYMEARKQLEGFQKSEFDKLTKQRDDFELKVKEASAKAMLMTPEMKQQKDEELSKQGEEIERQYMELMDENGIMAKKQAELMQPVISQINEVLLRIAQADEYDYIFDASAGAAGGQILFANEKHDISEQILTELQKDSSSQ
ncbi:OmpH family outer membrane protein [Candidatus Latescibacterota bacterium]